MLLFLLFLFLFVCFKSIPIHALILSSWLTLTGESFIRWLLVFLSLTLFLTSTFVHLAFFFYLAITFFLLTKIVFPVYLRFLHFRLPTLYPC